MAEHPGLRHEAGVQGTARKAVAPDAHEALAAGRYREAIRSYRTLAQTEPASLWAEGLSRAYRGRALELEAKGMPREALAIWGNRRWRCPGALPDPEEIRLLLALGELDAALAAYRELVAAEAPELVAEAQSRLAAHYLAEPEALTALADEDPVRSHGERAQAALAAYCAGDLAAAAEHLGAIPFRSPYRDFAILLKALLAYPEDPERSERLLAGIDDASAFARAAAAARLALLPEAELVEALAAVDEPSRRFATALRGWSAERYALWARLYRHGDEAAALEARLSVLLEHRAELGDRWSRQQLIRYAYHHLPEPLDETLTARLTAADRALLAAWQTERDHPDDPEAALDAWQHVIATLRAAEEPTPGSSAALPIAVIQRYIATGLQLAHTGRAHEAEAALAESVALDPDYAPGHRLLIEHLRGQGRPQQAREAAEAALARWPQAPELLQAALEAALDEQALEAAAGYAQQLLERDPINRRARTALHDALIARARSCAAAGDPDEARRALAEAARWSDSSPAREQIERIRAVIDGSHERGGSPRAIREAAQRYGDGLAGAFAVALEAERLGASARAILDQGRLLPAGGPPARADLLALCSALEQAADAPAEQLERALAPFRRPLKRAARLKGLALADYATACEALRAVGEPGLREAFARAALRHRPEEPPFILHALEARHPPGRGRRATSREIDQLQRAFRRAQAMDDKRTAHRLGALIKRLVPASEAP